MLNLKLGVTKNPRFEPLIDGSVKSDKLNMNIHVTTPPELFFKNLKNDEFDVFEMSLSEFLITREQAKGDRWQWQALPIFPAKAFVWMTLFINTGAGIQKLCDLKGKRVGIPDYVMTAGLWFRIILKELCAVQPNEISWYIGRVQELSHGGLLGMDTKPLAGVSTTWLTTEQTFDVMLDSGEIDAAYGFAPRHDAKLMTLNIDRYGGTPLRRQSAAAQNVRRRRSLDRRSLPQKNRHRPGQSRHRRPAPGARTATLAAGRNRPTV